jgi:hypothetical protein
LVCGFVPAEGAVQIGVEVGDGLVERDWGCGKRGGLKENEFIGGNFLREVIFGREVGGAPGDDV